LVKDAAAGGDDGWWECAEEEVGGGCEAEAQDGEGVLGRHCGVRERCEDELVFGERAGGEALQERSGEANRRAERGEDADVEFVAVV